MSNADVSHVQILFYNLRIGKSIHGTNLEAYKSANKMLIITKNTSTEEYPLKCRNSLVDPLAVGQFTIRLTTWFFEGWVSVAVGKIEER